MKMRTFLNSFFCSLIFFALANQLLTNKITHTYQRLQKAQDDLSRSVILANELRASNDELSQLVKSYIATLDPKYLSFYQAEKDIRDGKLARPKNYQLSYWHLVSGGLIPTPALNKDGAVSFDTQLLDLGFSNQEFNKLKDAKVKSDNLSEYEELAIHAARGEADDGTGAFKLKAQPDPKKAQRLIYSNEYVAKKAEIISLINEFYESVENSYSQRIADQNKKLRDYFKASHVLSLIIITQSILSLWYIIYRYLRRGERLLKSVDHIGDGNYTVRTGIFGSDEIGRFATAIDSMAEKIYHTIVGLETKAHEAEQQSSELVFEKDRSEKLLNNILPAIIAERLRKGEELIADTYPEVSVLFIDIVGFTKISNTLGAFKTVKFLNDVFGRLDFLTEKYSLEKIKTIGDCYMVVGGVPDRNPLHCQKLADFSLSALKVIEAFSAKFPIPFKVRIGMHSGTVVAGIVGRRKFAYDLWGDVVNVASRYENTCEPNKIHVSDAVRMRLGDEFEFEDAGIINLKGMGEAKSWYLIGRKKSSAEIIELKTSSAG